MSKISKYLQITEKLLLEYTYDINASADGKNLNAYVFKDNTGRVTFFNNPTKKNMSEYFTSGLMYSSFPVGNTNEERKMSGYSSESDSPSDCIANPVPNMYENGMMKPLDENMTIISSNTVDVPMQRVRIYIATGYTFNDCLGFVLSVKTYQGNNAKYPSTDKEIVLQNFTFVKGMMPTLVKFAERPFFQLSKFYDRYIEFYVPSAYYMALHKNDDDTQITVFDALNIEYGNQMIFEYATIEDENFNQVSYGEKGYVDYFSDDNTFNVTDKVLYYQGTFKVTGFVTAQVALNSNSDNFNLRLYEDKECNCIRYYPVWGSPTQDNPITRRIMNSIENGSIPLSMRGFIDDNDVDADEFEEIYGEEARKWIVVNQLELQFVYQPMISSNAMTDNEIVITRKFNYTEDFETDNDNFGNIDNIYKYVYRPVIESLNNGYTCNYIAVTYTARLVNRLNGEEIIRTATMDIEDAESKFGIGSNRIDVSNIYTWKLFNKIESTNVKVGGVSTGTEKTKYVTKFVNSQNFAMKSEDGTANVSGAFVIKLYDTEHIYKMRVFTDDTYSEAYQLGDANVTLMLKVTTGENNVPVYLKPTYSSNMNTLAGEIEFKIPGTTATAILKGDRKWFLVAQSQSGVSTLFAGKFESVFGD